MVNRSIRPKLNSFSDLTLQFPKAIQLTNGISCYIINGGEDEMIRISIYMKGGCMMESKPSQALLTSLMLLEGNTSMSSSQIAEAFDFYGARKSADSYDYHSEIVLTSLTSNFNETLKILANCIINPTFPQNELNTLKRRLAGNIQILQQRVKYIAGCEMKRQYYGETSPLGQQIYPETIMSITQDDLITFHHNNFNPSNCIITVAGMISDNVLKIIDNVFGQWYSSDITKTNCQHNSKPSQQMLTIIDKPDAIQSAIRMRIKVVTRTHPDYIPLRILIMTLGGYFGSRLMSNIREDKGYTYGIHASLLGTIDDGCIDISCECATQHTWNIINEVKNEIEKLKNELIPEDELETVKQHMFSSLAKTHDTPYNIAGYVSSTILFGVYNEYHNDHLKCLSTINSFTLRKIARKYLNTDKLRIVIAGNKCELNDSQNRP